MEFKCAQLSRFPLCKNILIESQWNLNGTGISYVSTSGGHINRITVEFKYITQTISTAEDKILIESQWNLNAERLY